MTGMWFIIRWGIVESEWSGPYETPEAAIDAVKDLERNDALEFAGVVGPLPFILVEDW